MKVAVVIPALDEAENIGPTLEAIPRGLAHVVVVVDGGSTDGTVDRARAAGADVVVEARRGYGRACATGIARAEALEAEVIAFLDAAGASDPADLRAMVAPILEDAADLVVGSRERGHLEPGALRPWQRAGNQLATYVIARRYGFRYTDLGSMRAIRASALHSLAMREMGSGWPVEMQVKALAHGLRVLEVPMSYRRRRRGRSKVSGTIRGSLRASRDILRVLFGGVGAHRGRGH